MMQLPRQLSVFKRYLMKRGRVIFYYSANQSSQSFTLIYRYDEVFERTCTHHDRVCELWESALSVAFKNVVDPSLRHLMS